MKDVCCLEPRHVTPYNELSPADAFDTFDSGGGGVVTRQDLSSACTSMTCQSRRLMSCTARLKFLWMMAFVLSSERGVGDG